MKHSFFRVYLVQMTLVACLGLNLIGCEESDETQATPPVAPLKFSGPNSEFSGSCDYRTTQGKFCLEFKGKVANQEQFDRVTRCRYQWDDNPVVVLEGIVSSSPCPTQGIVHRCTYEWFGCSGQGCAGKNTWVFYAPWTVNDSQAYCADIP